MRVFLLLAALCCVSLALASSFADLEDTLAPTADNLAQVDLEQQVELENNHQFPSTVVVKSTADVGSGEEQQEGDAEEEPSFIQLEDATEPVTSSDEDDDDLDEEDGDDDGDDDDVDDNTTSSSSESPRSFDRLQNILNPSSSSSSDEDEEEEEDAETNNTPSSTTEENDRSTSSFEQVEDETTPSEDDADESDESDDDEEDDDSNLPTTTTPGLARLAALLAPPQKQQQQQQHPAAAAAAAAKKTQEKKVAAAVVQKKKKRVNWGLRIKQLEKRVLRARRRQSRFMRQLRGKLHAVDRREIDLHKGWMSKARAVLARLHAGHKHLTHRIHELQQMYAKWNEKGRRVLDMHWWRNMVRKHFGDAGTAGRFGPWARNVWKKRLGWKPFWGSDSWRISHWGLRQSKWTPPKTPLEFPTHEHGNDHNDADKDAHHKKQHAINIATAVSNDDKNGDEARIPKDHINTWRDWIVKGNTFGVDFDRTADKFDDSVYKGPGDPMGPLEGGKVYNVRYKPGKGFITQGYNQALGRDFTGVARGPDPARYHLSLWGHQFTYDSQGKVLSARWGFVGHLRGCHACPHDTTPAASRKVAADNDEASSGGSGSGDEDEEPVIPHLDKADQVPLLPNATSAEDSSSSSEDEGIIPVPEWNNLNATLNGTAAHENITAGSWNTPIPEQDPVVDTNTTDATATTAIPDTTAPAAAADETTAAAVEGTTAAPAQPEETTAAAPAVEETTAAAPAVEETTAAAPAVEETTAAAPAVEETTAAAPAVEETTAAPAVEETTAAAEVEETTAAAEETTAEPEATTAAQEEEQTTAAPEETTAAAAANTEGEPAAVIAAGEHASAEEAAEDDTTAPATTEPAAVL